MVEALSRRGIGFSLEIETGAYSVSENYKSYVAGGLASRLRLKHRRSTTSHLCTISSPGDWLLAGDGNPDIVALASQLNRGRRGIGFSLEIETTGELHHVLYTRLCRRGIGFSLEIETRRALSGCLALRAVAGGLASRLRLKHISWRIRGTSQGVAGGLASRLRLKQFTLGAYFSFVFVAGGLASRLRLKHTG